MATTTRRARPSRKANTGDAPVAAATTAVKEKPKRKSPAKRTAAAKAAPAKKAAPANGRRKKATTTAAATVAAKPVRRKTAASKLDVYYEGENGALEPMGSYKGSKPEEALQGYFNALEAEELTAAVEARDYVVNTSRGLVRLAANQTVTITRR